jgi:acetyltransferase-like isoleucine patch superfamily enzyme
MTWARHLARAGPWRWWRSVGALLRGACLHPSAVAIGDVRLGRAAKVGARTCLDAGTNGSIAIGAGVWLSSDVEVQTDSKLRIGERTTVQRRCTINGSTVVGADCIFAPNVFVSSGTHPFRAVPHLAIREQERWLAQQGRLQALDRPVMIQDDCWLGTNVVVCPGVVIGKGCVIGANAVVTGDLQPYSVAAGAPARVIARRLDWSPPDSFRADLEEHLPYLLTTPPPGAARTSSQPWIDVLPEHPLEVALCGPRGVQALLVHCETVEPVEVESGGRGYRLDRGATQLRLEPGAVTEAGAVHCEIRVPAGGALRVSRIDVVPPVRTSA